MTFSISDVSRILALLEEQPQLRQRLAQLVFSDDLARLPRNVEKLAEEQARTSEHSANVDVALGRLADAQARTEAAVGELVAAQRTTQDQLAKLEGAVARLVEAQAKTEKSLIGLREAQGKTEVVLGKLTEAQGKTEKSLIELREAQGKTEMSLGELREAQTKTETSLRHLADAQAKTETAIARLGDTVGDMKGTLLEVRYRDHANSFFGPLLRGLSLVGIHVLDAEIEPRLSREAFREVLRADLMLSGRPRSEEDEDEVWLVVEVSSVIDRGDVERARSRAALLRQAGRRAVPVVAGEALTAGAEAELSAHDVVLVRNGRTDFWDAALSATRAA